jgi:hypothetical protein
MSELKHQTSENKPLTGFAKAPQFVDHLPGAVAMIDHAFQMLRMTTPCNGTWEDISDSPIFFWL